MCESKSMFISPLLTIPYYNKFIENCTQFKNKKGSAAKATLPCVLNVETEFDDIAILHDIVLAFKTHKAFFTGSSFGTASNEILV